MFAVAYGGAGAVESVMIKPRVPHRVRGQRLIICLLLALALVAAGGCSRVIKYKVSVAPFLPPKVDADTAQLLAEVNRVAQVHSLRGKVDIQFLDNSFAKCGIAEKYRTAEGSVTLQRPGQIYISIQVPFVGTKVADMASDGRHFQVAVFQGDEKFRRFVRGTNDAVYQKLDSANTAEARLRRRRTEEDGDDATTRGRRAVEFAPASFDGRAAHPNYRRHR